MIKAVFKQPFAEQVAYFKRKLNLPSTAWDDLTGASHDHAFVVAGAMKADLLADLREAVQQSITEGKSLGAFRQAFRDLVAKHGWTGWRGEGSEAGTAWRTRVIYKTNLATSYAAGRWQQMTDPELMRLRPYWRYVHNTVENPRLSHLRWHGVVLPAKHPWFNKRYPPNGFGCNCGVETLSERDLARLGLTPADFKPPPGERVEHLNPKTGEVTLLPEGIPYGWDYAPGASAAERAIAARRNRLETLDHAVARLNVAELVAAPLFRRFFHGELQGEYPVAVLKPSDQSALGAQSAVVLLSQDSLRRHLNSHPEIGLADYRTVQTILDEGEVYQQPHRKERLIYLTVKGTVYRAVLKRTSDGRKNYFLTLFKNETGAKPKPDTRIR